MDITSLNLKTPGMGAYWLNPSFMYLPTELISVGSTSKSGYPWDKLIALKNIDLVLLALPSINRIKRNQIIDVIDKKDRSAAGLSAPAQGLFLCAVKYPEAEITVINKVEEEGGANE